VADLKFPRFAACSYRNSNARTYKLASVLPIPKFAKSVP
jgi:hypothetical protein